VGNIIARREALEAGVGWFRKVLTRDYRILAQRYMVGKLAGKGSLIAALN
jgi:hypothetical protein